MLASKAYINRDILLSSVEKGNLKSRTPSPRKVLQLAIQTKAKMIFNLLVKKSFMYISYVHRFRHCLSGCQEKDVDVFYLKCREILSIIKRLMVALSKKVAQQSKWMSKKIASTPPAAFSEVLSLSLLQKGA
jgi:hypothetical protein